MRCYALKEKKGKKKRKRIKEEEKKAVGKKGSVPNGKVKERKVYDLPGQRHDQPEEVWFLSFPVFEPFVH